ncbi:MAG TPA: 5-(carboxyamino)imidazole ribonucleotide synthase [Thermoplasmataceae archaeon]|nr:5-(carboxyamino)imidazole ribonucleotide synthase [Thermoplasmatales archaeon AK]HLH86342.1 5-(carboxyamino)imidazole ribonucleotide synthase [Thermoplasmataceae archaeon]
MMLGIAGGGQLGRMMILEGRPLDVKFSVIDSTRDSPAGRIADRSFSYDQYREFVDSCDAVTFEFEHVDGRALSYASDSGKLMPNLLSVELKRDRSREKSFLSDHGLPTAPFEVAETGEEALQIARRKRNAVIKQTTEGYDGKGQYVFRDGIGPERIPDSRYIVEDLVNYDFECSIIIARDKAGRIVSFPPSYNLNTRGMLLLNRSPIGDYGMNEVAARLVRSLDYVGVMGVEFFVVDGKCLINEFAPRVHNSGHHTLLGFSMSQFELHVRTVLGLPSPKPVQYRSSGIVNLIGKQLDAESMSRILSLGETRIYWYGKDGVRNRRKLGHVNIGAQSVEELEEIQQSVISIFYDGNPSAYM